MSTVPREIGILGVYMPSLLISAIIGIVISYLLLLVLTRTGLTRYFYHVMLLFVSLTVIITLLVDKVILLVM